MIRYYPTRLILLVLLAGNGQVLAQEDSGVSGTWSTVIAGPAAPGRCGQSLSLAELDVSSQKSDAENPSYHADVTVWFSSQRCLNVRKNVSTATMIVRGTRISLSYDNEEWGSEMLVLDGNQMAGIDNTGESIEWHKAGELPVSLQTGMVRQNLVTSMKKERLEELQAKLVESGHGADAASELVLQLIDGFASCVVDVAQLQSALQRLPYDEVLKIFDPISGDEPNQRVARRLDKKSTEMRTRACFYEVGDALGVRVM